MASTSTVADLSWLPSDYEEQLALSFRIISNAYKTRMNSLEAEIRALKAHLAERAEQLQLLTKKQNTIEVQLIEETQRANQLSDENKQLVATIRKLNKDINRLETFKKNVEASIKEEKVDSDDIQKFYSPEDVLQSAAPRTMQELIKSDNFSSVWALNNNYFNTNSSTLTSSLFPIQDSKGFESKNYDQKSFDGKAFFKAARCRLSNEQFNLFISSIRKLNAHQQTKEETIKIASSIFGESNADLFEDFKLMLTKNN